MHAWQEFAEKTLGKKINNITYIACKDEKIKRHLRHFILGKCDCGNESWYDISKLMVIGVGDYCKNCNIKEQKKNKPYKFTAGSYKMKRNEDQDIIDDYQDFYRKNYRD